MGHDEGHLHLAAAGLLRKQLGLRVVSTDERIAGILVQLLGLLKVTLTGSIECSEQVGLGVTRVCDDLESNHRDFFFGCHIAFLSHMNQWRASRPGIRAALCMPETLTFKQKRTIQNVVSGYERSIFTRERFLNYSEQYRTHKSTTKQVRTLAQTAYRIALDEHAGDQHVLHARCDVLGAGNLVDRPHANALVIKAHRS